MFEVISSKQVVEMVADGETVDVGVRNVPGCSLVVDDHMEQGSPLSCAVPTGLTPTTTEA